MHTWRSGHNFWLSDLHGIQELKLRSLSLCRKCVHQLSHLPANVSSREKDRGRGKGRGKGKGKGELKWCYSVIGA